MYKVLPLFKSHYSIGRSILTLDKASDSEESGPDSIIKMCKEADLKTFYLVEDTMSGFLQAHLNAKASGLNLIY